MTNPMATPSKRALARKDTTPKPKPKVRKGADKGRGVAVALAFGIDTSNLSAEEMAEVIDPDKPLTDKQKLFVQHWAKGDSITSASYRAGYSNTKVAYQLVKMPNILKLKAEYDLTAAQTDRDVKRTEQAVADKVERAYTDNRIATAHLDAELAKAATEAEAKEAALALPKVQEFTTDRTIHKVSSVPGRILKLIVG